MPSRSPGDIRIALVGAILALAVVGILTAAGCGGDNADQRAGSTDTAQDAGGETQQSAGGDKTFHGDGFSFTYPNDWTLTEFTEERPPDRKLPGVRVRPQEAPATDGVSVIVYDDQDAVGEGNLDEAVDEIAAEYKGVPLAVPPTPTTVGGLPAIYLAGPARGPPWSSTTRPGTPFSAGRRRVSRKRSNWGTSRWWPRSRSSSGNLWGNEFSHHSLDADRLEFGAWLARMISFPRLPAASRLHSACAGPK